MLQLIAIFEGANNLLLKCRFCLRYIYRIYPRCFTPSPRF